MKRTRVFGSTSLLLTVACASLPRPQVVSEADRVASTPAAKEAAELAPQAHAHAVDLRQRAEAAYDAGDLAASQILGEHAIAAMTRAFVLSRLVKAEQRLEGATTKLTRAREKLAKLDEQAQHISAEADSLELRTKVLRDAEPLGDPGAATPEREQARRTAARALVSQARLLCMATRLLEPKRSELAKLLATLDSLDQALSGGAPVDLNAATRARSDCLRELTLVRRPELLKAPAEGITDALLEQLTETEKFFAFRDDRGVVVVLRDVLGPGNEPTKSGAEQLQALGRVAKAHPKFPVLVVTHAAAAKRAEGDKQLEAVVAALRAAGAAAVEGYSAGNAQPVLHPKRSGAAQQNARIEVVFVAPGP